MYICILVYIKALCLFESIFYAICAVVLCHVWMFDYRDMFGYVLGCHIQWYQSRNQIPLEQDNMRMMHSWHNISLHKFQVTNSDSVLYMSRWKDTKIHLSAQQSRQSLCMVNHQCILWVHLHNRHKYNLNPLLHKLHILHLCRNLFRL